MDLVLERAGHAEEMVWLGLARWVEAADGEERQHLEWKIQGGKPHELCACQMGRAQEVSWMNERV
jgi:hypothetical protein